MDIALVAAHVARNPDRGVQCPTGATVWLVRWDAYIDEKGTLHVNSAITSRWPSVVMLGAAVSMY